LDAGSANSFSQFLTHTTCLISHPCLLVPLLVAKWYNVTLVCSDLRACHSQVFTGSWRELRDGCTKAYMPRLAQWSLNSKLS